MIVVVESNFVLELALRQEEFEHCEEILRHAEAGSIRLAVPAYSLVEPYQTWHRRAGERERIRDDLERQLSDQSRSEPYARIVAGSTEVVRLLSWSISEDKKRIDHLCQRLITVGTVVHLTPATVETSIDIQVSYDLSPQDAIVLSSVRDHLRSTPTDEVKVFVTRDPDGFLTPDIAQDLGAIGARIIPSFAHARALIDAQ